MALTRWVSGKRALVIVAIVLLAATMGGYRLARAGGGWPIPSQDEPSVRAARVALFRYFTAHDEDWLRTFCRMNVLEKPVFRGSVSRVPVSYECEQFGNGGTYLWDESGGGDVGLAVLSRSNGSLMVRSLLSLEYEDGSVTPEMRLVPASLRKAILGGGFRGGLRWSDNDLVFVALRSFGCNLPASPPREVSSPLPPDHPGLMTGDAYVIPCARISPA